MHRRWNYPALARSRISAGLGIAILALVTQSMLTWSQRLPADTVGVPAPVETALTRTQVFLPIVTAQGGGQPLSGERIPPIQ